MAAPMKILQVCSAESLGGGERHVVDLTRALIARGHQLHLAVRPDSPLFAELSDAPVTWYEFGLRNALDVLSAHALAAVICREGIDVLHAHVGRDYTFCGVAARMARHRGQPARFFITRHHFNPIKTNPVYTWTIAEARALIAVSESVRERLAAAFPQLLDRIVLIPNWVDTSASERQDKATARARLGLTRRLAVGIIGRLTPLKRQDLFIKAAAHLIRARHWKDTDFLIVGEPGPGDEAYAEALREMVNDFEIGAQVRFTGYVEDLPAQLVAFDIVTAPSDNEAFSLALVEAMAAGCAVIATRAGGMAEIVQDGSTGLFVEPDNEWALLAAISRLLTDKALREKLGRIARADVVERFDRAGVIERIERLYLDTGLEEAGAAHL